ncbi:MAG: hydroxyethylthiazole kinase, partial [Brevibacterium aurantiacum]
GAVTAAYLVGATTASARFEAVVAAHAHFKVAGETAAEGARGPGSFSVNFLDALHTITGDDLAGVHVESDRVESSAIDAEAIDGAQS